MGRWFNSSVTVSIPAPKERVWAVWSDLEGMPRWIRWIESVRVIDRDISEWTMDIQGFQISWTAVTTRLVPGEEMHWETVDGLPFKGCVRFSDLPGGKTRARLSISYELPQIIAPLMDSGMLEELVRAELAASLKSLLKLVVEEKPG